MKMIIVAAGQGTRLRPLTDNKPKCMVEYHNKPIIDYILDVASECNIRDVAIVNGYKKQVLEKYLENRDITFFTNEKFDTTKFSQRLLPRQWKKGPTITVTSLPDDYVHYSQPRTLTVREWARLQTFPDWYQFAGQRTTGGHRRSGMPNSTADQIDIPKYTQIGNAVPVKLAKAFGEHFKRILNYK